MRVEPWIPQVAGLRRVATTTPRLVVIRVATRRPAGQGDVMRICLRILGLDMLDLTIETDTASDDSPGDAMSNALGFTLPETPPHEVTMPEWR